MTSLQTFVINTNRLADRIPRRAEEVVDEVGRVVLRELVTRTPADTGLARSNWRAGSGAPPSAVIEPYAPGEQLGIAESANADAAINAGNAVIATRRPGSDLFIQNNVPYIVSLNNGSSRQAPANFVEAAVTAGVSAIQGERLTEER